ncbi:PrgI family protein [Bacillus cereus]
MNNNFVVSIPKELKNIKSKLFLGLTKRQLIGFSIALAISLPVFFLLKSYSVDIALFGLFLQHAQRFSLQSSPKMVCLLKRG